MSSERLPVRLRPIRPGDRPLIVAAFERLSEESRYRRFFAPMKELTPAALAYLTEVDHHDHEAVVALTREGGDLVGVARYVRSESDPTQAEAAVTVIDEWQGRGLGRLLLQRLARRARAAGVRQFTALVKVENPAALELLRGLGPVQLAREGSEFRLVIDLPQRGMGVQLARALRAAAAGMVTLADSVAHRTGRRNGGNHG